MAPGVSEISSSSSSVRLDQGDGDQSQQQQQQQPNRKPGPIQKLSRMFSQSGRNSAASSAPPTPGVGPVNGSSSSSVATKMGPPPSSAPGSSTDHLRPSPPPPHLHLKTGGNNNIINNNNDDVSSHGETMSSRPGSRQQSRDQTPLTSPASSLANLHLESGYETDRSGKGSTSTANRLKQKLDVPPRAAMIARGTSPSAAENKNINNASSQNSSTLSIPEVATTNNNNNNNNIATASTPSLQAPHATTAPGRRKSRAGDVKQTVASPSSSLHLPAFWNSMNPNQSSRPGTDRKTTDSPVSTVGPPTPISGRGALPADNKTASKRFIVKEDGSHEHVLRGIRRQEKLGTMLWELLGRKKEEIAMEGENLSLVHAWVDGHKNSDDNNGEIGAAIPPSIRGSRSQTPSVPNSFSAKYGKCQEVIGKGAFGIVRIAHKVDPCNSLREQLYAVKEFRKRPQENEKRYTQRLTSEFCISSSLRHPNIIHTLDLLQDQKGEYCEVMEYCSGGDLYTLILASGKGLEVGEADCFFKQLMRGVVYMHEMGVAHRDLKPENLLLTCRGALKITDFGNGECFRMAWESKVHMTNGVCGSAPYISPEEYIEKEFDPRKVDVWATGVIYMAMRTGRHLWRIAKQHEDEFYDRYLLGRKDEGGYEPIEQLQREQCRNVIYSILDPISSRRITGKQVLNSEWGRQIRVCDAGDHGS